MKKIHSTSFGILSAVLLLSLLVGCKGGATKASFSILSAQRSLISIQVTPTNRSIAKGTTKQFSATGIYSDNTNQDLTAAVTWSSSSTGIATVSSGGLATSVGEGTTTITATSGAISGTTVLNVTAATLVSIQVTAINQSIAKGTSQQFAATGIFTDNTNQDLSSSVTWTSSNPSVATVSAAGLATSLTMGSTTITATSGLISGSRGLTVTSAVLTSIDITPNLAPGNPVPLCLTEQFTATGIFSDSSHQDLTSLATWTSSNTDVATVSNTPGSNGLASSFLIGFATISATYSGLSGSTVLEVRSPVLQSITITPASPSIPLGLTKPLTATGAYSDNTYHDLTTSVTWSSSDYNIASISNAAGSNGLVSSMATGTATVSATFGSVSGNTTLTIASAELVSIQITPGNPGIPLGLNKQFTATGTYTDNGAHDITDSVTWSSTDTAVAAVSNAGGSNGLAASRKTGSTTITATYGTVSGSATLTVTQKVLASIEVSPIDKSIATGTSQQFSAIGIYTDSTLADVTSSVTWTTSNSSVATISNAAGSNGLATSAGAAGTATVTAISGALSGKTTLQVASVSLVSIQVSPTNPRIALGTSRQFTATGIYSNGASQDITGLVAWTSTDGTVCAISNAAGSNGLASAVAAGPVTISASMGGKTGATTLTVTAAALVSIQISPTNPAIAEGTTKQFTAIGIFDDNTTQDLTTSVSWNSSDAAIATVSAAGLATGIDNGSTTVTAASGGISGRITLIVTSAKLQFIQVSPTNTRIARGTVSQFTAIGLFDNGTSQDITQSVTWTSSDDSVAALGNARGTNGLATSLTAGTVTVSAKSGVITGSTTLTVTQASLVSIQVSLENQTIAKGTTIQFAATGIYDDNSSQDLTAIVTWTSSDTAKATVNSTGLATSVAAGTATITARLGTNSGSTALTVAAASLLSIQISPTNPIIALGSTKQMIATGVYSDNSHHDLTSFVTWTSSNAGAATVDNAPGSNGLVTTAGTGSATITAILGPVNASATVTVTAATLSTIQVTPTNPTVVHGTTKQFTATGIYSDDSRQDLTASVTWSSSDPFIAGIDSSGLATGAAAGSASITATLSGKSNSTNLTVTAATLQAIQVSPTNPSFNQGLTKQFTAIGIYSNGTSQDLTAVVTWTSDNTNVATVSNAPGYNGFVDIILAGSATITAASAGVSGSTSLTVLSVTLQSITVTPALTGIALGTTQQFAAMGSYSNGTAVDLTGLVTWSSSDTAKATINSTGLATPVAAGPTTVTARLSGISGGTKLTVTAANLVSVQITPINPSIALGTTTQFSATGVFSDGTNQDLTASATWRSSTGSIATVGSTGHATSVAEGSTTITATFDGISGSTVLDVTDATLSSIQVLPANPAVPLGSTKQFTATGMYSNGTRQDLTALATWTSSDASMATISNVPGSQGLATTIIDGGPITITATFAGVSGNTGLTVSDASLQSIQIAPATGIIALGTTRQFTATGIYSDNSHQDLTASVTWSSSDATVLVISNAATSQGLATSISAGGPVRVAATFGSVSGTAALTVSSATLSSIQISPVARTMALGTGLQFTATGVFSDNRIQDLTSSVTWTSSNAAIAAVSNAPGSEGLVTSVSAGPVMITATISGVSSSAPLTVTAATLQSIEITPGSAGIDVGTTAQFTATGVYSDTTTQDLTSAATWNSSVSAVATVNTTGLATGFGSGSTTITAIVDGVSGNAVLSVTAATLVSIQVTPTNTCIGLGSSRQLTATGIYSNGNTQDLTGSITWSSSAASVVTINNAGLAASLSQGSATITATWGLVSGSTTLTVTPATLVSIQLSLTNPSIALGTSKQFAATGIYSDGTNQNLTASVAWGSSNSSIAAISNSGLATSIGTGSTTITAASDLVSVSTTLTVTNAGLVSIQVTPTNPGIALGTSKQFIATGIYTNGTRQDLTASVMWSSSNTAFATISNAAGTRGLATPVAAGTATITAASGGISGATTLTVKSATLLSIQVTPTNTSIAKGTTKQFTATGFYSDSSNQNITSSVTWTSSDTSVGTVSNVAGSKGLASSFTTGQAVISATLSGIAGTTTLTVTNETLASIQITPSNPNIPLGTTKQFTATGVYTDNTTQDLTSIATWTASNTGIASMDSTGVATAVAQGTVIITATSSGISGSTTATVTNHSLQSIQVAPTNPSIALGTTQQFTVTGIYSDNTSQDLTSAVIWDSSNWSFAAVSNAPGSSGLATSVGVGTTIISASYDGMAGSTALTVTNASLVSIQVSPSNTGIAKASTVQFTATGIYTNNSSHDLTSSVTWTSSNTAFVAISNSAGSEGLATSIAEGTATITAIGPGVSGSTDLTVTAATLQTIQVSPLNPSIGIGATKQFAATGFYSDNTIQDLTAFVSWSSSNAAIASISNSGFVNALTSGPITISASVGGKTGSTTLTVTGATLASIEVTPTDLIIGLGSTKQFTAMGSYSDGTIQDVTASVTWISTDTSKAAISNSGLATTITVGTTTITASLNGVSGSTFLDVTNATLASIQVTPTNAELVAGTTRQFAATGIYSDHTSMDITAFVTWISSDPLKAAISSTGLATGVSAGQTAIKASLSGLTGSTTLTVTQATLSAIQVSPTNPTVSLGTTKYFTATGIYSNNSIQDLTSLVVWTSSDSSVVSVSNGAGSNGFASTVNTGSATITAILGSVSGTSTMTVTNAVLQSITVTPALQNVALGMTQQFTAIGTYSDDTTQDLTASAVWTSSDTTIAVISNAPGSNGLATPVGEGTATITATLGGVPGTTDLTVNSATLDSIDVTPLDPSVSKATNEQFYATGNYSDGTTQDLTAQVTWVSSNTTVATISNAAWSNGLAVPVAAGTTSITAWFEGMSGTSLYTVTPATLVSISITPSSSSIPVGTSQQFTATGTFSDTTTQDITTLVAWNSSAPAVATISNSAGSNGSATPAAAGTTTITAAMGSVTQSATLTVSNATLNSITVSSPTATVTMGTPVQFTATGNYSDGPRDISNQVTWKTSNKNIATVSNTSGSKGLVTPVKAGGPITITATMPGTTTSGTISVTVAAPSGTLQWIEVTPANPIVKAGKTQQFTATGHYSDGSTLNLNADAKLTWSSSNTAVATIIASKPAKNKGLATCKQTGTATITATYKGTMTVSGNTLLTVN